MPDVGRDDFGGDERQVPVRWPPTEDGRLGCANTEGQAMLPGFQSCGLAEHRSRYSLVTLMTWTYLCADGVS